MDNTISKQTKTELLRALCQRYRQATKEDKTRILDEFVALAGCHRKPATRLLTRDQPLCRSLLHRIDGPMVRPCAKPSSSSGKPPIGSAANASRRSCPASSWPWNS